MLQNINFYLVFDSFDFESMLQFGSGPCAIVTGLDKEIPKFVEFE